MKKNAFLIFQFLLIYNTILFSQVDLHLQWESAFFNTNGGFDTPQVRPDQENNVIIFGRDGSPGPGPFFRTTKLDSLGNILWSNTHEIPGPLDIPADGVIDGNQDIIVSGKLQALNSTKGLIIKYGVMGDTLWSLQLPESPQSVGEVRDLLVDKDQNIYALGACADTIGGIHQLTVFKLTPGGQIIWQNKYALNEESYYIPRSMRIVEDQIIVFAANWPEVGGRYYVIHQVDLQGQTLTTIEKPYDDEFFRYVTIDQEGAIYLGDEAKEYVATKLNLQGDTVWIFENPVLGNDIPNVPARLNCLTTDKSNELYIAGMHWKDNTDYDILVTKLNDLGEEVWNNRYHFFKADFPQDIFVDSDYVYVVGNSNHDSLNFDFILLVYSKETGEELATARYEHNGNTNERALSVFVKEDVIYVSGTSGTPQEAVTLKYRLDPLSKTLTLENNPSENVQVYPSPFSREITIHQKDGLAFTKAKLYDVNGVLVFTQNIAATKATLTIPELADGNYLLKLMGEKGAYTQVISKLGR